LDAGVKGCSQLTKAIQDDDIIYLYDKYIFAAQVPEVDNLGVYKTPTYYYTSSSKTNLIEKVEEDVSLEENAILSKYSKKAQQYKHTFKKDTNGNYYWVSTEPIN